LSRLARIFLAAFIIPLMLPEILPFPRRKRQLTGTLRPPLASAITDSNPRIRGTTYVTTG
jgi:hypothetical protein